MESQPTFDSRGKQIYKTISSQAKPPPVPPRDPAARRSIQVTVNARSAAAKIVLKHLNRYQS